MAVRYTTLLAFALAAAGPTVAQHVFIDSVQPAYDNLPACAEQPLSTIIRDMVAGCGDGGATTSYACFCQQRSAHFVDVISSEVSEQCTDKGDEMAESALGVFGSYCALVPSNGKAKNGTSMAPVTTTGETHQPTDSGALIPATRVPPGPIPSSGAGENRGSLVVLGVVLSGLLMTSI